MKHTLRFFFVFLVIVALYLLVMRAEGVIEAAQGALFLCYKTVIPALFPFFVLSGIITGSGFSQMAARWLTPVMRLFFRMSGSGALSFVMGLLSGYPTGAKVTAELYENHMLTKEESERLLAFCNNSGPLFIIGAVGTGMLRSTSVGVYLYIVHILSAVLVGMTLGCFFGKKQKRTMVLAENSFRRSLLELFTSSVSGSVNTMLLVCGYIVLFAALSACVSPFADRYLSQMAALFIKAVPEVTNGVYLASKAGLSPKTMLSVISLLTGFGGICVFMQVASVTNGSLSLRKYFLGKTLQGLYAAVLTYVSYPFCVQNLQPAVALSGGNTSLILSLPPVLTVLPVLVLFMYVALRLKKGKRIK